MPGVRQGAVCAGVHATHMFAGCRPHGPCWCCGGLACLGRFPYDGGTDPGARIGDAPYSLPPSSDHCSVDAVEWLSWLRITFCWCGDMA